MSKTTSIPKIASTSGYTEDSECEIETLYREMAQDAALRQEAALRAYREHTQGAGTEVDQLSLELEYIRLDVRREASRIAEAMQKKRVLSASPFYLKIRLDSARTQYGALCEKIQSEVTELWPLVQTRTCTPAQRARWNWLRRESQKLIQAKNTYLGRSISSTIYDPFIRLAHSDRCVLFIQKKIKTLWETPQGIIESVESLIELGQAYNLSLLSRSLQSSPRRKSSCIPSKPHGDWNNFSQSITLNDLYPSTRSRCGLMQALPPTPHSMVVHGTHL